MANGSSQVSAVVLAGGGSGDSLALAAGVEAKALVPLKGRPLGAYVLEALARCRRVGESVYVGPCNALLQPLATRVLPGGRRFTDSLALGLGAALAIAPERPILVLTADIPWVTAATLERFIADAGEAELAYPVIREALAREAFPEQRRTYVRLREGRFTGGNAMLLQPSVVGALLEFAGAAFEARKSPLALARLVGPLTALRLAFGSADLPGLEASVGRRLGARVRAVVTQDASLGADVDRPEHLPQTLELGEGLA